MHDFRRLSLLVAVLISGAILEAAPGRPNILLVISDDLTACLGSYGHPTCQTPALDRLASEGVRFERAYCQYPVCGPSRASLMSGLYPGKTRMLRNGHQIGSFHVTNPELAEHPSIGGFLRRQGYFSARVSKIYHMGVPGGIEAGDRGGDDPDSWDRAFDVMAPETTSPGELELLSPKRKHYGSNFARIVVPDGLEETQADHLAASQAIAILENRSRPDSPSKTPRRGEPFFLAVGFVRPHVPLIAPREIFELYPEDGVELPEVPEGDADDLPAPARGMLNEPRYGMSEIQKRRAIAAYHASVTFMDRQVGRLLDALDRLGLRENTIVIFTSDHGYNLGEHDAWQKLSLFEESTRVPLIISAPGMEKSRGQACPALVELVDLYPTLADLCGLADRAPSILQGHSLKRFLLNPRAPAVREAAYTVTYRGGESIRTLDHRYSRWGKQGEELYDLREDPGEFQNLVEDPAKKPVLEKLRRLLEARSQESIR